MIRDSRTQALVSVDAVALDKYKQERQRANQINQLRKEVADLQHKVRDICDIIDKIIKEK